MLEKNLVKNLMRILEEDDKAPFRIENLISKGTPDIGYVGGFIEAKIGKRTAAGAIVANISPEQKAWHRRFQASGGVSFFVAQCGKRYYMTRDPLAGWEELQHLIHLLDWL